METLKQMFRPKTWLLFLVIPVLCAMCKKDNLSNPFASLNNQLVCKINGVEWRSKENKYSGFYDLNPYVNLKYILLVYRDGSQEIRFRINFPYRSGKIYLNNDTYPASVFADNYASFANEYPGLTPSEFYVTNSTDVGEIDFITMDTINKKIKAKFSFIGKDSRSGKKINVTNGYLEYHQ